MDYRSVFAVLAAADVAFGVLQSLMLPILPTIQHHFRTSQAAVTWLVTAYLLSASVATPVLGRFGEVWGKDRMLFVTLLALSAGCVLAAVATIVVEAVPASQTGAASGVSANVRAIGGCIGSAVALTIPYGRHGAERLEAQMAVS